jgi:AbrB family looped-hinge helix DNA binding protein
VGRTVRVDRQGRVVIPLDERERLGWQDGARLDLVPTPEGLVLERRRSASLSHSEGVPLVSIDDGDVVSNAAAVEAIHRQRDGR